MYDGAKRTKCILTRSTRRRQRDIEEGGRDNIQRDSG